MNTFSGMVGARAFTPSGLSPAIMKRLSPPMYFCIPASALLVKARE